MLGIGEEFAVFIHAILTGIFVTAVYFSLRMLRRIFSHALWIINLEDAVFWGFTAIYMFVQIYHTSDGNIRWYFVLGVVFGSLILKFFLFFARKIGQKMYIFIQKKMGKKY